MATLNGLTTRWPVKRRAAGRRDGAGINGSPGAATLGTWLRGFKRHNVRQLDAVFRELLERLWDAGAGHADPGGPLTID